MNRLGIFCMHDKDGVVDDYVLYLLAEIKKELGHLTVICNGKLTPEGREKLERLTDDIFVRANTGFEIGAWRHGILWKRATLANFDVLVLFNDSFFGPLYPFKEIFAQMEKKPKIDFWGITIHGETKDAPEHLQIYFLVVRRKMLHSAEFMFYWQGIKENSFSASNVENYKLNFTKYFFSKGFRYAVYCDTRDWEQAYDLIVDHCVISAEKLLTAYRCPIIKKKLFLSSREDAIGDNYGYNPRKSLDFIKTRTNYDVRMIWQNILRNQNIAVLKSNLGLDYILPKNSLLSGKTPDLKQAVIIAHLYYEDLFPECVQYLCNSPKEISLIATVSDEKKKARIEELFRAAGRECDVRLVSARGRDLSALLVGCADAFERFKYLCFVHDKKSIRPNESVSVGGAFFSLLWSNVLESEIFIRNLLSTFEREPQLGLLVPPQPHHGGYGILFFEQKFWSGSCFEKTLELAKTLGISQDLFEIKLAPLAIGSVFWCRTEAFAKITAKNWRVEDFQKEPMDDDGTISHALERIFPFAAQAAGFYTGWLMTSDFIKDELENFIYFSTSQNSLARSFISADNISLTEFLKSNIPPRYWFLFRPFRRLLLKLGFNL